MASEAFTPEELQATLVALEHLNTYETPPDPPTPGMMAQDKVRRALGLDAPEPEPTPPRSFAVYTYASNVTPVVCHIYAYDQDGNPLNEQQANSLGAELAATVSTVMVLPAEDHSVPA